MSRSHHLTGEEILAAQLRIVLDEKLGRTTPELVTRIANALPGDPIMLARESPVDRALSALTQESPPGPIVDIAIPGENSWSVVQVEIQPEEHPRSSGADAVIRTFTIEPPDLPAGRLSQHPVAEKPRPVAGQVPWLPPRSAGHYPVNTPMYARLTAYELKETLKNVAEELEKAAEKIGNAEEGPGSD
ncbi:hypothetical protein [Amycolatopsis sp. SID8362]|uniref:hypothetical protein n=1 Tax=Amycolatopsis sp. SID8362 TaxID=2690346 RepID=UPI00137208D3|nr:hypothetical protein [Amycolatopsis sp. SID8362]